jgi:hypothetical protein
MQSTKPTFNDAHKRLEEETNREQATPTLLQVYKQIREGLAYKGQRPPKADVTSDSGKKKGNPQ